MRSLLFLCSLYVGLHIAPLLAQTSDRVPSIGILTLTAGPDTSIIKSFRAGLQRFGYIGGQNVRVELKSAGGQLDQLPKLAEELVRSKPDVIVTGGGPQVRAVAQATSTIPIVVLFHEVDPTFSQLIESYRRPGSNVTGVDGREVEVAGKRIELLKEVLPSATRVAVLWSAYSRSELDEVKTAARSSGIKLHLIEMNAPYDFDKAFNDAKRMHLGGAIVLLSPPFYVRQEQLNAAALRARIPTVHAKEELVRSGGLISYGTAFDDTWGRAAYFVDRILKGAKPSELPVEQVSTFRLTVNLKTAKALRVTVPQSVLLRADEVIH
jgi:putative tryptophan/tyrosine transport system substrate-binding protein